MTFDCKALRHPASLTPAIVTPEGQIYTPTETEIVGHFQRDWRGWGMFWGSVSLTSDVDLGAVLNEEVERFGGNGVINLTVQSHGFWLSPLIALLLIVPDTVSVVVEGDVVRTTAIRP